MNKTTKKRKKKIDVGGPQWEKSLEEAKIAMAEMYERYKDKFLYITHCGEVKIDKYNMRYMFISNFVMKIHEGVIIKNRYGKISNSKTIQKILNEARFGKKDSYYEQV